MIIFTDSLTAVSMMIDQMMELHPAVQYFHIGADEVNNKGTYGSLSITLILISLTLLILMDFST